MKRFVFGTIFFVLFLATCIFSDIIVIDSIKTVSENDISGLALIITVPLAIVGYSFSLLFGLIGFSLLCGSKGELSGATYILSVIFSATIALVTIASIVLFCGGLIFR